MRLLGFYSLQCLSLMDRFYSAELPLIIESTIKNNMHTISEEVERLSRHMLHTAKLDWQRIKKGHPHNVDSVCQIMGQEIVRMSLRMSREFKKAHDRISMRLNELVVRPNLDSSDSDDSHEPAGTALHGQAFAADDEHDRPPHSTSGEEREQPQSSPQRDKQQSEAKLQTQIPGQHLLAGREAVSHLSSLRPKADSSSRCGAGKPVPDCGESASISRLSEARQASSDEDMEDPQSLCPYSDEKAQTEDCIGSIYYSEVIKSAHLSYRFFRFSDLSRPASPSTHRHLQGEQRRALLGDEQVGHHHIRGQRAGENRSHQDRQALLTPDQIIGMNVTIDDIKIDRDGFMIFAGSESLYSLDLNTRKVTLLADSFVTCRLR